MEAALKPRPDLKHSERPASGRRVPEHEQEPTTAELAECTCPEFCERDHGNE